MKRWGFRFTGAVEVAAAEVGGELPSPEREKRQRGADTGPERRHRNRVAIAGAPARGGLGVTEPRCSIVFPRGGWEGAKGLVLEGLTVLCLFEGFIVFPNLKAPKFS
ncbi:hypothetical protein CRG98_015966 [Punica granatum]|uniref:Uncharacterized protein n=1 Tax=Punica granatum TaxID=22663 RepID=A0A2I0K529_PUNGR|nr:hypothetical protein CRG98_015966 [Punica granatum]